jgi:outer membrane receptor protein involved in Fe transport
MTPSHYLIFGLDAQIDRVKSDPDSIMYGDRQVNNLAAYVQDEIEVTPRLTATAGLRLDHNILIDGKKQSQLSPKLAAVYHLRDNLTLRALAGQAFRAPSIAERFFQKEISGGTSFVPNPSLKAERMNSVEVGSRLQIGEWLDIDAAFFHYRYSDMIYWVALPAAPAQQEFLFQVRNLNRALMQGLEIGVNFYRQPHLRLHAGYTYLDAQDRSTGRTDDFLAYRIRHALNFGGNFAWKKLELNLDGRYNGRVDEVFLYPNDRPAAYVLLNAKLTAHLTSALEFSLSSNNILDSQYEELARYRMPGRHWIAGASFEF